MSQNNSSGKHSTLRANEQSVSTILEYSCKRGSRRGTHLSMLLHG